MSDQPFALLTVAVVVFLVARLLVLVGIQWACNLDWWPGDEDNDGD